MTELVYALWHVAGVAAIASVLALFALSQAPAEYALRVWVVGFLGAASAATGAALILGGYP
jgi:hypothetical protein